MWSGTLPGGIGQSQVVCLRAELPADRSRVFAVMTRAGSDAATTVAAATDSHLCSRRAPAVVIAWWWRSAQGHWHHIAVGSGAVRSVQATVAGQIHYGLGYLVSGPYLRAAQRSGRDPGHRLGRQDRAGAAVERGLPHSPYYTR